VVDKILKGYKINQSKVEALIYHLVNKITLLVSQEQLKEKREMELFRLFKLMGKKNF